MTECPSCGAKMLPEPERPTRIANGRALYPMKCPSCPAQADVVKSGEVVVYKPNRVIRVRRAE